MIQSIENTKLNCVKLYRETHRLTEEIKSLKKSVEWSVGAIW